MIIPNYNTQGTRTPNHNTFRKIITPKHNTIWER